MVHRLDKAPTMVEVFSLKSRTWRIISAADLNCWCPPWPWCRGQSFFNGKVHWVACERKSNCRKNQILSFNVSMEKFSQMKVPKSLVNAQPMNLNVHEVRGMLAILHCDPTCLPRPEKHCDVWVMTRYAEANSWSKIYRFDVGTSVSVSRFWDNDDILLVAGVEQQLVSYNPKTQERRNLGVRAPHFNIISYRESLVMLDNDNCVCSDCRTAVDGNKWCNYKATGGKRNRR